MMMIHDPEDRDSPSDDRPTTRRPADRMLAFVAWLGILVGILLWVSKPGLVPDEGTENLDEVPSGLLLGVQDELMGRMSLGLDHLFEGAGGTSQAAPLAEAGPAQRVAYALLEAASMGPEVGEKRLEAVDSDPISELLVPPARTAIAAMATGEPVPESDVRLLEDRLGWFGRLAEALPDPDAVDRLAVEASSAVTWLLGLVGLMFVAGLAGLIGLVVVVVRGALDARRIRLPVVSRPGVYAETFALWLFVLLLLQFLGSLVPVPASSSMLVGVLAFFASLGTLAWPVWRGKSWTEVRTDLGLARPRFSDLPLGVATWAMALPFLGVGAVLALVLQVLAQALSGEVAQPGHPAQQAAVGADLWQVVQLYLLASVAAPVVEEVMFRGVFLTHLRGATRRWNLWLSMIFGMLTSSLVFAAIHPQGLLFIPPLAGLAIGFCVGRVMSGRIGPAIVAHGVSNALVMSINVILFA